MSIKLAQASSSEFYSAWGVAGRQRDGELNIVDWAIIPEKPWTHVFRAKDPAKREIIASTLEKAVANYCIGYSQNNGDSPRTTLWDYAQIQGWDVAKVNKVCNCDCSSLVAVAVRCAGVEAKGLRDMYTGSEYSILKSTGEFEIFTDAAHVSTSSALVRGDILLRSGHTAVAIETASTETESGYMAMTHDCVAVNVRSSASTNGRILDELPGNSFIPFVESNYVNWVKVKVGSTIGYVSGKYCTRLPRGEVVNGNVNVRNAVSTGKILCVAKNGDKVHFIGSTKNVLGTTWYKVFYNNCIGWVSGKYIKVE